MARFSENNLTAEALRRIRRTRDPRLKRIMTSLIRHLHAFTREMKPTQEEWMQGIRCLTETGKWCDSKRQEWILMSDTLGVSMLVDALYYPRRSRGRLAADARA